MHCPRCGQQQVSEEIKFCSRCGLPLGVVSEVVAQGGYLPQLTELGRKKTFFNKKNGVMFSLFWLMFFLLIMAPFFGILDVEELAGVSAIIGIFGGLMWMIGALVFLPSSRAPNAISAGLTASQTAQGLYGQGQQQALPPQQSQPVSSYVPAAGGWRAPDTGEFANPGSVTDSTTKLLKHDE
jgi:hypothetical protein